MTLPLEEIEAKARAAPVGDALRAINAYLTILDPETVLALVARVRELEAENAKLKAMVGDVRLALRVSLLPRPSPSRRTS